MCLEARNQLPYVTPQPSKLCLKVVLMIPLLLLRIALVFAFLHEKWLSYLEEAIDIFFIMIHYAFIIFLNKSV